MNALYDLWRWLTEPGELDPDDARLERLTRIILVMMEASLIVITLLVFFGWALDLFSFASFTQALLIDLPVVAAAWLVYTGRWRWSTYLLPAALILNGATLSYIGGYRSQVVFYVLAIMLTGVLHGTRAQWFMAGLSLVVHVAVSWVAGFREADVMAVGAAMAAIFFSSVTLLQAVFAAQWQHALSHARAYAQEITAYKQDLEEVVARYQQIVDYAPAGILEVDLTNLQFVSVNDVVVRYLGYTREELMAINPLEVLPLIDKEAIVSRWEELLDGSRARTTIEFQVQTKDGREIWALLNTQVWTDAGGTVRARIIGHDITQRKKMEEELRRSLAELENLQHITDALLRLEDLPSVMNSVAEGIVSRLGHDIVLITRYDQESGSFRGLTLHPLPEPDFFGHLLEAAGLSAFGQDPTRYQVPYRRGDHPVLDRLLRGELVVTSSLADCLGPWVPALAADIVQQRLGLATIIDAPMQVQGKVVGALLIGTKATEITVAQEEAIARVADQAAIAIEKARLLDAERQRSDELARSNAFLTALSQVAARIESAPDLDQVLDTLSIELGRLGLAFYLGLLDLDTRELVARHTSIPQEGLAHVEANTGINLSSLRISLASTPFAQALNTGEALFVPDPIVSTTSLLHLAPNVLEKTAALVGLSPRDTAAFLPLRVEHNPLGIMTVWGRDLRATDVPALSVFANQVAVALQNARLVHDLGRSLQELRAAQDQLVQAQKMEAIGRLAGGVAHDFNNLLTVIGLGTRVIDRALHPADPLREHLQHIQAAGERGMRLTQQLLSFSRREAIEPQVLDLNRTIADLSQMLRRMLGEDVELVLVLANDLDRIRIAPSQMEQVIINLAVNARDAMPRGGKLLIETAEIVADHDPGTHDLSMPPGSYVRLSVSDTGTGLSEAVRDHLFEPFFTTKEQGAGTGLGLPTVYGIVKQNQGHIKVSTETGRGTTFELYFPPTREAETSAPALTREPPASDLPSGTETVLLVEDEAAVRRLAGHILVGRGYHVLVAGDGTEAIRLATEYGSPIDLLLTDVVMPGMNGKELVSHIQAIHPQIHVLFMSGYSGDVLAHHDVADHGSFLAKPFTLESLTHKVRAALDSAPAGAEQPQASAP